MMTYSIDFRQKVLEIKNKEGLTFGETAKRFGVGIASLVRWCARIDPVMKRRKPATKIDREALQKDVTTYPDAYQHERAKRLGVSQQGIHDALRRLGVTYKKKPSASQSVPRKTITLLPED